MTFINHLAAAGVGALAGLVAVTAHADHRPVIAVPGHPEIPAVVDGVDASYAVVIGEWGLYRAGQVAPKVIRPLIGPPVLYRHSFYPGSLEPGYYPATGRRPRYGRQEIVPAAGRPLRPPAPSYQRSWSAESAPGPVTDYAPFAPPDVTIEPRRGRRMWRRDPHGPR
jgi:hypothetical protein